MEKKCQKLRTNEKITWQENAIQLADGTASLRDHGLVMRGQTASTAAGGLCSKAAKMTSYFGIHISTQYTTNNSATNEHLSS